MKRTIFTLVSLVLAACALQAASSPGYKSTKPSPRELFEVNNSSKVLSDGAGNAQNLPDVNSRLHSSRISAAMQKAADKSPEFVGLCKNGGSINLSKTTLDNPPVSSSLNFIQQGFEANAGVYIDGKYYTVVEYTMAGMCFFYTYDSSLNWVDGGPQMIPTPVHPKSMAYDASTSTTYGCFADKAGTAFTFSVFNIANATTTDIASLSQNYPAMAADPAGTVYAIGEDNNFYTIDKATAETTRIGETGISASGPQSLCFDNDGTTLYWFVNNAVYTLDTATGAPTPYLTMPASSGQWYAVYALPEGKMLTPTWVDDFTVNFPDGNLTGEVSMKMPTQSTLGDPITSALTYHLFVDDNEVASKDAVPGGQVTCPLTLTTGMHTFRAYAEYDGYEGLDVNMTKFIGHDTPKAPSNIRIEENEDNSVNIFWDAVTSGANDGYIDTDNVRYSVVRTPGDISIADNIATPTCVDATINALDYYTYRITATDGVTTSEPGVSAQYFPGSGLGFLPPFSHDFSTGKGLFTVVDANNDGVTWDYSDGFVWFQTDANTDNDDWIISPPITLSAGKIYSLYFHLLASSNWEYQVVELRYGKGPEPAELTNVILPAYPYQAYKEITTEIEATEDGQYYFGIHALTKKTAGAISIQQFAIGAGYTAAAPGAPTDLVATPAPNGANGATISFKCPVINYGNTELSDITKVVVTNETTNEVIAELTDATPGKVITDIVDTKPANGSNTYTVVCYNASGDGKPAQASCWVGLDTPGQPGNIRWMQQGNSVRVSWQAPETGSHGGYISPENIRYRVTLDDDDQTLVAETSDLFCEYTPEFTRQQQLLLFNVTPINESGDGETGMSNESAAGTPYPAPFFESFENSAIHSSPWLVNPLEGYNSINIVSNVAGLVDMQGIPVTAVDYDYGMAVYTPLSNGRTRLELPIVDISTLKRPVLKMWCLFLDNKTTITIQGNNNSGTEWTDIADITRTTDAHGWNLAVIPLDKFQSEGRLQLGILCSTPDASDHVYVLFDKISIEEGYDTDLVLADVTFPDKIYAGKDFSSTLKVNNGGLKDSPAFEAQLFIDGKFAASVPCEPLASGAAAEISLTAHLSSNATSARVQAQVLCLNDQDVTNNALAADIYVVRSSLPAPDDLTNLSESGENAIRLSWTQPDCRYESPVTDSFENLETASIGGIEVDLNESGDVVVTKNTGVLGDYKLVDNDMLTTTITMPLASIPNAQRGMVCQVIDVEEYNLRGTSAIWAAHSGNKLLAFWQCMRYDKANNLYIEDDPNDDWFILPELSETNKLISFWAKSLSNRYGTESFEIMVSTETDNIEDFELFAQATDVPAGYANSFESGFTFYEFDLPEEARYVAIRYNAAGTLALLLDDLTYTPAGRYSDAHLIGYNVYRNDVRINNEPLTENELKDIPAANGDYYYNVTAVYTEGESPYSNTVTVSGFSGIDNLTADGEAAVISVENPAIVVTSPAQTAVTIYAPDGRLLREAATVNGKARIAMAPGIYIVKAGTSTRTVIIK